MQIGTLYNTEHYGVVLLKSVSMCNYVGLTEPKFRVEVVVLKDNVVNFAILTRSEFTELFSPI